MPKCQYKYQSGPRSKLKFECDEPSIEKSNFCFFHDNEHYANHEEEAATRFREKVKESISNEETLNCIGYYLPAINFVESLLEQENYAFPQPVNFYKATFYKGASFSFTTFKKRASFAGATFREVAKFLTTTFTEDVDFSEAIFCNVEANFFRATFSQLANFEKAKFTGGEAAFREATFSQYVLFSEARIAKANFFRATFSQKVDFLETTFSEETEFGYARFLAEATFVGTIFTGKTVFRLTVFEKPDIVIFEAVNLSKVSFQDSDITRIRFGSAVRWREEDYEPAIIEEEWLRRRVEGKKEIGDEYVSLETVLSVYRNLRENYEFRLSYDKAGKVFIKEMELKRKYREVPSISNLKLKLIRLQKKLKLKEDKSSIPKVIYRLEKNRWFRRQFSLTGLYYHLSRYGESISIPTIIGVITVILSTLLWVTQGNPILEPHFDSTQTTNSTYSTFVGFEKAENATHWLKSFERSLADFLPLLPAGDFKLGIIDFIIKIVGGALTFGLLLIAFRRKFERKFTR